MRKICFGLFVLACLFSTVARAEEAKGHFRATRYAVNYVLQGDGRLSSEYDQIFQANILEGVNALGRWQIPFHSSLQSVEILTAETIKADGRRIPVLAAGIETQTGGMQGFSSRQDLVVKWITFPELVVGDSIHLRHRLNQDKPLYPGRVAEWQSLNEGMQIDSVELGIDAPADMLLNIEAEGLKAGRDVREGGRRKRAWSYRNPYPRILEPSEIDTGRLGPHLLFSNFSSWREVAEAGESLFKPKASVNARVEVLAREIVGSASEPNEKARLLYDWVRTNIRYVATYIGAGGFEPHPADWILDNRYGDCKDHVVLLEALLRAQGIESTPALITSDYQNYRLSEVPNPYFNHVITYVPVLDRYLDSTASTVPFEMLPEQDADKPVLLMYEGKLARTPMHRPVGTWLKRQTTLFVNRDGSAERSTEIEARHYSALEARDWFRGIGPGKQTEWVLNEMNKAGLRGTGVLRELEPSSAGGARYLVSQHLESFIDDEDIGSIRQTHALDQTLTLRVLLERFRGENRTRPGLCVPVHLEESFELRLGKGLLPLRLPKDRTIEGEGMRFEIHYVRGEEGVLAQSVFDWSPESYACTASQYRALMPIAHQIDSATRTSLAYERDEKMVASH